jgi:hypothetical protein
LAGFAAASADHRWGGGRVLPLTGVFPKWSQAIETIEHTGYQITFDVADRGKGWTWTFQIDSGPVIANTGAPHPNEILARLEAISVAERKIESATQVAAAAKRSPGES